MALSELKLNSRLVTYLRRCEQQGTEGSAEVSIDPPACRNYRLWSIEYRLSEADIQVITTEFMAGTPKGAGRVRRRYAPPLLAGNWIVVPRQPGKQSSYRRVGARTGGGNARCSGSNRVLLRSSRWLTPSKITCQPGSSRENAIW